MSAEEVKKVMAVQWEEKEPYCMPHGYQYKLENVDNYLKEMDELLLEAGMEGLGYQSQAENIQKTALGMGLLNAYISTLMSEIDAQIDQPLYRGFQNEATEQLSRIRMEDYSTENTLGLKRHYKIHDAYGQIMEYDAQAVSLTMKDFLGLTSLNDNAGHGDLIGMPKEFSDFTNLFAVEYDKIKDNLKDETGKEVTLEEYLTYLNTKGEFDNKMDKPLQELISAILDVTIIKPLIEMCTGYDMITGEDLTDFERGLKGVFAVVDVVTLFIGIKASGVAKLFSREALETGGRIIATDLISNGTAYAVGKMGEELGLPLPITLMLSLGAGVTVSLTAGKYVFKDSAGNVVLEAGADEVDEIRTQIKRQAQNGSDALEGGSGHRYSVDSAMFPDDEAAGVLRNGEYVKNPTAHNINDYISEGSNYLGSKNMNGQYMYVVDMDGNIIIGTRGGQRMPHPTLVGGRNPQVQAAGMIEIRGGKIYSINNASGHFKPSIESLEVAEDVFSNLPQNIFSKDFQGYLPYGE